MDTVIMPLSHFNHSSAIKKLIKKRQEDEKNNSEWKYFLDNSSVNELALKARDLFELIHNQSEGIFKFEPSFSIGDNGSYRQVRRGRDPTGKLFPIGWYVVSPNGINKLLRQSGDVETQIWRKMLDKKEDITCELSLFNNTYKIDQNILNKTFSTYELQRNFTYEYNFMPNHIESAFNHVFEDIPFKVEGFPYPHKKFRIQFD